jgi:ankyrin repeat protein
VNQALADGAKPLFVAAQQCRFEVLQLLLQAGAAVNQARVNGATPLLMAANKGNVEIVEILLAAGAAVNQAQADGKTMSRSSRFCLK